MGVVEGMRLHALTPLHDQALAIHEPTSLPGLCQAHSLLCDGAGHEIADADVCRARAHEEERLLFQCSTGYP